MHAGLRVSVCVLCVVCFGKEMSCGNYDSRVGIVSVWISWPSFYVCVYKMSKSSSK